MLRRILFILFLYCIGALRADALSLALDSVAEWGKFPRFCVNTYRWGDHFFNGYDSTYVVGTGYKFNVKTKMDSWLNAYSFYLPDNVRMHMRSKPSTSIGGYLTYLAVSVGYDRNISRFFGGTDLKAREQFAFGFNCSLFSFNMQFVKNTGGVTINKFSQPGHSFNPDIQFNGLQSSLFGFDTYYFFNHKRYSQAAAFSFSRVQVKSQGSWFAGLSFYNQTFNFDFNDLPAYMLEALPAAWENNIYEANTKNWALKCGYGYNYVFRPHWLLAVSESPSVGIKRGRINNPNKISNTFDFSNHLRLSVVWNNKMWFAGVMGEMSTALIYDQGSAFQTSVLSAYLSLGYRFNVW